MPILSNVSIKGDSWSTLLNMIYPVGSIYISAQTTSPASSFGGSWTKLNTGVSLMCSSNAGTEYDGQATIGNYAGSHYITTAKLPSHQHWYYGWPNKGNIAFHGILAVQDNTWGSIGYNDNFGQTGYTNYVGGGERYFPYHFGVFMWRRTA